MFSAFARNVVRTGTRKWTQQARGIKTDSANAEKGSNIAGWVSTIVAGGAPFAVAGALQWLGQSRQEGPSNGPKRG